MSVNRVQKLLFSEYCDFEDMVLIESPFAQTTKDGKGIRQVHLGLTPSKLVLATDVLPPVEFGNYKYHPGIDPEIETFELIAIYPVECVNLSVYRRRKRQALKARFCNNRVTYFELGGFEKRGMFWNLWCEKVKFLCPGDSGSSRSETSVATSTTGSTLYLLDRRLVAVKGIKQLWCRFGPNAMYESNLIDEVVGNSQVGLGNKWTDRHLYLGKNFVDMALEYQPIVYQPTKEEFVRQKQSISQRKALTRTHQTITPYFQERGLNFGDSVLINRFASGVNEGCNTGLYLTVDDYVVPRRYSQIFDENVSTPSISSSVNYEQLAESAVLTWEFFNASDPNKYKVRHKRRYGFAPKPLFLYGFGPWTLPSGDRYSTQMKRAVSEISLRRRPLESELKLPISKRKLIATVSCQCLSQTKNNTTNIANSPKKPIIYFWTCDYWYRPNSAKESYEEQQKHLKMIYAHLENRTKHKKCRRKFLRKCYNTSKEVRDTDEDSNDELYYKKRQKRKSGFIYNIFSRVEEIEIGSSKQPQETSLQYVKRILKVDVNWSAWDFDSTALAEQLTMIDKELFLKIPPEELGMLVWQQNTKNAPNISAILAFSHRTSCLIASEVLKDESEKTRARLLARFINVADKCHRISNFQSCRSVLSGIQSPAIYRLRRTWAYMRKKHASKYLIFEYLCRLYRDPRLPSYQKTFYVMSQNSPYLPYIGDIIVRLLNKVPQYKMQTFRRSISRQPSFSTTKSHTSVQSLRQIENTQNLFTKILKAFTTTEADAKRNQVKVRKIKKKVLSHRKAVKFKGLYEYFKPLAYYEDCRLLCLEETREFLEKCQLGAMNYNFNINDVAKSYILKARYTDDMENFYNSLRTESPSHIANKSNI